MGGPDQACELGKANLPRVTDLPLPIPPSLVRSTQTTEPAVARSALRSDDLRRRARRWWRRRPINRALVVLHRWPSLVLGLLLVVECTTGAILLYNGDLFRATNTDLYHHTASATPISSERAFAVVDQAHPAFGAQWVATDSHVFVVGNESYSTLWFVDPGTGHINGAGNPDKGFLGLLVNIHDCAFTCEGLPGYNSWFGVEIWHSGPSFLTGITRGGMILGILGLVMILLVVTSIKIWWPGRKRLKQRVVVRRGRGRFARDYDLHNVIGAVALPFILMWGITGAAFEFPGVENAWVALTGGDKQPEPSYSVTPNPAMAKAPTITVAQATDAALAKVPGSRVQFIGMPTKDADYYEVDLVTGYAANAHRAVYGGDAYVYIDAHDASNLNAFDAGDGPVANRFYDKFLEPTHFGWNVNGWWRIMWAVLGLAPLALMVTGVSTWLFRRGVKKRRRQAGRVKLRDAQIDPDHLARDGDPELAEIDPGASDAEATDDEHAPAP